MRKLKRTEVREFKRGLVKAQSGVCPLCLEALPADLSKTALDHDHLTGECRGVLHLACNKVEGSVFNTVARWGRQGKDYSKVLPFLERLVQYLRESSTGVIYHLHKSPEEIREKRNRDARLRRARAKAKALVK